MAETAASPPPTVKTETGSKAPAPAVSATTKVADGKAPAGTPAKTGDGKKPDTPPKEADGKGKSADDPAPEKDDAPKKNADSRFVRLSQIVPLPGTYIKDEPREDYKDLIASIKKTGLEKPVILRQGEKGEFQLVDGFHRCKALEKAGMLEIRADLYDMSLADASRYRKEHRQKPDLPIPGKLIPKHPVELVTPEKAPEKGTAGQDVEIPKDFKLPIVPADGGETITTMELSRIENFKNHPFNVADDKDMWDLVDSIKKFGVLEPAVIIPRQAGGYEMVSGHRRKRACELAGLKSMPVIIRNLDRDEAIISMVDANLKRENISPMEKARAYKMKLDAMKRKAGRHSKEDILRGEKPVRSDELLAQQTGESRSNIQKIVRLNNLTPELQKMVDDKTLPVHTASDLSYLKKEEQDAVADAIEKEGGKVPSGTQAAELKKESQQGTLTTEKIESTVAPTRRELNPPLKVTFNEDELRAYFPEKGVTVPVVKRAVFEALDLRKKALARQAAKEDKAKKPGLTR